MKFKVKSPMRLASIVAGCILYLGFGSPALGLAFLVGSLVGSFNLE